MVDFYVTTIRTQIQTQFQYRAATYMYMLGMVAEPVIYLVVWTTIARSHGGTRRRASRRTQFAAYYIVWTLVRTMNIVFTPFGWEWRIREGELSAQLLRPLHPIHYDLAWFAGQKVVVARHVRCRSPSVSRSSSTRRSIRAPLEVVVFLVAIWGAYVIRSMNHFILGMITIWTTRAGAIFEVWFLAELLLSGRLAAADADAALGADARGVAAVQVDVLLPDRGARRRTCRRRSCSAASACSCSGPRSARSSSPSSGGSSVRHYSAVGN